MDALSQLVYRKLCGSCCARHRSSSKATWIHSFATMDLPYHWRYYRIQNEDIDDYKKCLIQPTPVIVAESLYSLVYRSIDCDCYEKENGTSDSHCDHSTQCTQCRKVNFLAVKRVGQEMRGRDLGSYWDMGHMTQQRGRMLRFWKQLRSFHVPSWLHDWKQTKSGWAKSGAKNGVLMCVIDDW